MGLYVIPIVIILILILVGGTLLYRHFYERSANEALRTNIRKSLPTPFAMFLIAFVTITVLMMGIQFLPILTIEDVVTSTETPRVTVSAEPMSYNTSEFEYYDMKIDDDGMVIAYSNHQFCSGYLDTECDYYLYNRSQIRYFDRDMQEVWTIGSEYSNDPIVFDNQRFDARAIARLADGSFVAFGAVIDLETMMYHAAILRIDPNGTITDLHAFTLTDAGFLISTWADFEVVATSDGGFTLLYYTHGHGTILIHLDATAVQVWEVFVDNATDSTEFPFSYVPRESELLSYSNHVYAVRLFNSILVLSEDGSTRFRVDPDFTIDTFSVIGERLVVTGTDSRQLPYPDSAVWIGDRFTSARSVVLSVWSITDGTRIFRSAFRYGAILDETDRTMFVHTNVAMDDDGTYYLYADSEELGGISYVSILLRFDSQGEYRGGTLFKGSLLYSFAPYSLSRSSFKKVIVLDQGRLSIHTPNALLHRTIDLDDLSFDLPLPMPYPDDAYAFMIRFRVASLQAYLMVDFIIIAYVLAVRYRKDAAREREWSEQGPLV